MFLIIIFKPNLWGEFSKIVIFTSDRGQCSNLFSIHLLLLGKWENTISILPFDSTFVAVGLGDLWVEQEDEENRSKLDEPTIHSIPWIPWKGSILSDHYLLQCVVGET